MNSHALLPQNTLHFQWLNAHQRGLKLKHPAPLNPQHSLAKHAMPAHGAKIQQEDNDDDEQPVLLDSEIKCMQKEVSITSCYAAALDNTSLMALNDLAAAQSTAKRSSKEALKQLLDYVSTHSNAKIRHYESPTMLQIHSDASYLSVPKARSMSKVFFFLSNNPAQPDQAKINGVIM